MDHPPPPLAALDRPLSTRTVGTGGDRHDELDDLLVDPRPHRDVGMTSMNWDRPSDARNSDPGDLADLLAELDREVAGVSTIVERPHVQQGAEQRPCDAPQAPKGGPARHLTWPALPKNPRAELTGLVEEYRAVELYTKAMQRRYCDLSLALNEAGLWAPAYRPTLKIPRLQRDRNESHQELLRDRIVMDLHWMHRRGLQPLTGNERIAELLDPDRPFDFSVARELAGRNWTLDYRNEVVSLTPQQDAELGMLRSPRMRELTRECLEGMRPAGGKRTPPKIAAVRAALARWAARDPRVRPHVQSYLDLWLARELLGEVATRRGIAELAGLISGAQPKHERTASDQLAKLDRALGR